MQTKQINITHHNRTLTGIYYKPDVEGRFPLVIFSHGYNGCKEDFDRSARYFAENGIGAFCYTFCGGSTRDTSGFPTTEMTLFTEKEDLNAVIDEVQTWEEVDRENRYLFGGSQGGMVSALAAEERSAAIRGLLLLYPAFCIADDWNARFPNAEEIPDSEELWGMKLGRRFFETIRGFQIREQVGRFPGNVLIMHGSEDSVVSMDYAVWASEQYPNAVLEIFQGEGHGFSEEGNRRMEAMALYFIHECMRG
ncbi:MAG: alpha/beta hydrolase [bacterium]|nr:alpha/beta hydrolase [bacterium]